MPVHPRHLSSMEPGTARGDEDVQNHTGQHLLLPLIIMTITRGREKVILKLPSNLELCVG